MINLGRIGKRNLVGIKPREPFFINQRRISENYSDFEVDFFWKYQSKSPSTGNLFSFIPVTQIISRGKVESILSDFFHAVATFDFYKLAEICEPSFGKILMEKLKRIAQYKKIYLHHKKEKISKIKLFNVTNYCTAGVSTNRELNSGKDYYLYDVGPVQLSNNKNNQRLKSSHQIISPKKIKKLNKIVNSLQKDNSILCHRIINKNLFFNDYVSIIVQFELLLTLPHFFEIISLNQDILPSHQQPSLHRHHLLNLECELARTPFSVIQEINSEKPLDQYLNSIEIKNPGEQELKIIDIDGWLNGNNLIK